MAALAGVITGANASAATNRRRYAIEFRLTLLEIDPPKFPLDRPPEGYVSIARNRACPEQSYIKGANTVAISIADFVYVIHCDGGEL